MLLNLKSFYILFFSILFRQSLGIPIIKTFFKLAILFFILIFIIATVKTFMAILVLLAFTLVSAILTPRTFIALAPKLFNYISTIFLPALSVSIKKNKAITVFDF